MLPIVSSADASTRRVMNIRLEMAISATSAVRRTEILLERRRKELYKALVRLDEKDLPEYARMTDDNDNS
jgi:hypothetical protein